MGKIIMLLHLPEPKIRKRAVKAVQKHKGKTKYSRKHKHKATEIGGLMFYKVSAQTPGFCFYASRRTLSFNSDK